MSTLARVKAGHFFVLKCNCIRHSTLAIGERLHNQFIDGAGFRVLQSLRLRWSGLGKRQDGDAEAEQSYTYQKSLS